MATTTASQPTATLVAPQVQPARRGSTPRVRTPPQLLPRLPPQRLPPLRRRLRPSFATAARLAQARAPAVVRSGLAAFSLRCDTVRLLLMAVSAVYPHRRDAYGVVKANAVGIRINVETAAKSMQAHVFINRDRCVRACALARAGLWACCLG